MRSGPAGRSAWFLMSCRLALLQADLLYSKNCLDSWTLNLSCLLGHYPLRKMCLLGNYFVILNEIPTWWWSGTKVISRAMQCYGNPKSIFSLYEFWVPFQVRGNKKIMKIYNLKGAPWEEEAAHNRWKIEFKIVLWPEMKSHILELIIYDTMVST